MRLPLLSLLIVTGTVLALLITGWSWVLVARNPLQVPISNALPWPVACSTRGCITTRVWQRQQTATEVFANLTERDRPTIAQSLTTLTRQHLAHWGQLKSPVTIAAATRYREEILHATDETLIRQTTGMSAADYDKLVILPYLEQESLRAARRAESPDDLYKQLAGERWVVVLPWHLTWDRGEGRVIQK